MTGQLFFTNIPYNCSDQELKDWIESRGLEAESIHIIRDLETGASPAFAYAGLKDRARVKEAVSILNGKKMRASTIIVKEGSRPQVRARDCRADLFPLPYFGRGRTS